MVVTFGWTKLERKISCSAVGDFKSIILDYSIIFLTVNVGCGLLRWEVYSAVDRWSTI